MLLINFFFYAGVIRNSEKGADNVISYYVIGLFSDSTGPVFFLESR